MLGLAPSILRYAFRVTDTAVDFVVESAHTNELLLIEGKEYRFTSSRGHAAYSSCFATAQSLPAIGESRRRGAKERESE